MGENVLQLGRRITLILCAFAASACLSACATPRANVSEEELARQRQAYIERITAENTSTGLILVKRLKAKHEAYISGASSEPAVLDTLILSGGSDYGAFGAGFLKGWSQITNGPLAFPDFDLVTGVSTGSMIAPFVFLGTREAIDQVYEEYSHPKDDWVRTRGLLFFLPANESLMDVDGLARDIGRKMNAKMIDDLAARASEGRVLAVSATNLDFGMRRVWDLGDEAIMASRTDHSPDRIVSMMLASCAIPGLFPPVEIDGHLYVDGGTTANILYNNNMRSPAAFVNMWKKECPGYPVPKSRYWVIINNQLSSVPKIAQPTWLNIMATSFDTAVRATTATAIEHLATQLALLDALGEARSEFHVVWIPDDWRPPKSGFFEPETMQSLAELGMKLGADPASWKAGSLLPNEPGIPESQRAK